MAFNNRNNLNPQSAPWGREVEQKVETNAYDLNQLRLVTENNNRATAGTLRSMEEVQRFTLPTTQALLDMEERNIFVQSPVSLDWVGDAATLSEGVWKLPEKTHNIQGIVGGSFYIPHLETFAAPKLYAYIGIEFRSSFNVSSQLVPGRNYTMGAVIGYARADDPSNFHNYTHLRTNASYGATEGVLESGSVYTSQTWVSDATAEGTELLRVQPYCNAPYTVATPSSCTMSAYVGVRFEVRYTLASNRKQV